MTFLKIFNTSDNLYQLKQHESNRSGQVSSYYYLSYLKQETPNRELQIEKNQNKTAQK